MNFRNILADIAKAEPEVYEQLSDRRQVLKNFGTKVAVAALPFAIGGMFQKAYGKTTADAVLDALNYLLKLEYFGYNFYHTANNTGGLIPAADKAGFTVIATQEKAHVDFLIATITAMGGTPHKPNYFTDASSKPPHIPKAYDFTKGGVYHPFADYVSFLVMAQTFKDMAIRAYQGQMATLLGNMELFTQMQQILCVEGRHAGYVRTLRRLSGQAPENPAPWITNNIPPVIPFQPFYVGEDQTTQTGVNITALPNNQSSTGMVPKVSATAAFDEGMDMTTVLGLVGPFIRF